MVGFLHQLVQGQSFLSQPTDESAQGCQAPSELLHISYSLRQLHSFDCTDLLRICFNALARHQEAEQLASRNTEGTLGQVDLDSESSQVGEGFLMIIEQGSAFFGLDHNIINIHLHIFANLIVQTFLHASLVSCTSISQTKCHSEITINPLRGDKRCFYLILLQQGNLVETRISIDK